MRNSNNLINAYVIILIMWVCLIIIGIVLFIKNIDKFQVKETIIKNKNTIKDTTNDIIEKIVENIPKNNNKMENIVETIPENDNVSQSSVTSYTTRLTSFYANDGYGTGSCTGTGLCENDFQVNENGWYTYQGKLVLATATPYLANQGWHIADGVHLYKYYEEIILNIDGVDYEGIVVDSCGNCCETDRVDLFVSNAQSVKDTTITVKTK